MRLVRGRAAGPQLLQREHQLDGVEQAGHPRELRRGQPAREPDDLRTRHVDIDEQARELEVGERHRLGRDLEVEPVRDEEAVDDVELGRGPPVHPHDDAVLDDELRLGVVRAVQRDEAELRRRRHEHLAPQLLRGAGREAGGALRSPSRPRVRVGRRRLADEGRRLRRLPVVEPAVPMSSSSAAVERPGPQRRVDLEQLVVGNAGELGGTVEVVGELARGRPPARPRPAGGASPAWRGCRRRRACRPAPPRA